jgi:hypothetical protein
MTRTSVLYSLRIATVTAVFGAGYLAGSSTQHTANAQLGELGSDVMKRAGESGGALGSVAKLGTTISDLEKHVSGLQKNIDTLKSVKSALGGVVK